MKTSIKILLLAIVFFSNATFGQSAGITIVTQPTDVTTCGTNNVTYTVEASGTGLNYQWQVSTDGGPFTDIVDNSIYSNSKTNVLTVLPQGSSHYYKFQCTISNSTDIIVSSSAALIVNEPITQVILPVDTGACKGSTIALYAEVKGSFPITYEWSNSSGKTMRKVTSNSLKDTLIKNNLVILDTGTYTLKISNSCGTISNKFKLKVLGAYVASQPQDQTICAGNTATFTISAFAANGNLTYQWQENWGAGFVDISGATSSTLSLSNVTGNDNGTEFMVILSDGSQCPMVSNPSTLTVLNNPIITSISSSETLTTGDPLNLSVSALGSGTLMYQWYKNGTSLGTPTLSNSYKLSSTTPADSGNYTVKVTNNCNSVISNVIPVMISSFSNQPSNSTAKEGDPVTLSASTNLSPVTYQWQVSDGSSLKLAAGSGLVFTDLTNNAVYSNVDGPDLHIANAAYTMNGNVFRCKITSNYGIEYSKEATLSVTKINAVDNSQGLTNLSYYPNPATFSLFIQGIETTSTATIMDLSGKIQKSEVLQVGGNLSLEDLNDGMYILEIRNSSGTSRVPLVIKK